MSTNDPYNTNPPNRQARHPHGVLPPYSTLGGYRILGPLGRGGMGVVYEAEPLSGGTRVALKTISPGSDASLTAFKSEFRSLADLAHPNLVGLRELVTTAEQPFFTMELIRGETIDQFVRPSFSSQSIAPQLCYNEERLRRAFEQLAQGLHALHGVGCLHRDLKPGNVLVTNDGRVVILDLGLAVHVDAKLQFQNTQRERSGTLYYMSPEQLQGQSLTSATDWYAVGVMLYEALTGEKVFRSSTITELLEEKKRGPLVSPREVSSEVAEDLSQLAVKLLSPNAQDRPSSSRILEVLGGAPVALFQRSTWIGRNAELKTLEDAWTRTRNGETSVVLVAGRSGMGKTALVERFLSELKQREPVVILRGRCYENESVAYQGFDSAIDSLADYLNRLRVAEVERVLPLRVDALCQVFPILREVPVIAKNATPINSALVNPREQRLLGFTALREMLSRVSRWSKIVLFVDDLQQGDSDTASLFRELLKTGDSPNALFLGTFRIEEADRNECLRQIRRSQLQPADQAGLVEQTEIIIDHLNPAESERLASELLKLHRSVVDPKQVQRIATESAGDPLFIQMLVEHALRSAEPSSKSNTDSTERLLSSLPNVIWDQVNMLDAPQRLAIELLSCAGRPLSRDVMEVLLSGHSDAASTVRALRVNRLARNVNKDLSLDVFHDKIRETVVARMASEQMSGHCLEIARVIEPQIAKQDSDFLADLYRRGGKSDRAGELYAVAANYANEIFAFSRAVQFYRRALELSQLDNVSEQKLRTGLAGALANASHSAEAAQEYMLAAQLAPADEQSHLMQLAAMRLLTSGHVDAGVKAMRSVLDYHHLPWPKTTLSAVIGIVKKTAWLKIRGLKVSSRRSDSNRSADVLDACWGAAAGLSVVDPVRGAYFVADNLCRSLAHGDSPTTGRDLAAYMGHVAIGGSRSRRDAARVLRAIYSQTRERRTAYIRAISCIARGIAALLRGRWGTTIRCCDRAASHLLKPECHGATWELNTARTFALWALKYQGNLIELARRQPELIRWAEETNDLFASLNFGTQVMTNLMLASDDPQEALRRLDQDWQRLPTSGFYVQHHNHLLATTAILLYQGQGVEAWNNMKNRWASYRSAFLSQVQQVRIDYLQLRCRAALGAAAAAEDRDEYLREAAKLISRLRSENVAWSTALATGFDAALSHLRGRAAEASEKLTLASQLLDKVDMRLFAASVRYHLGTLNGLSTDQCESHLKNLGVANAPCMARCFIPF